MPSDFDTKRSHSPQYSFGINRSFYDKVYYETNKMFDKNVPGPGKYNILKPFGSDSTKYSMYSKPDSKNLVAQSKYPGPGEYPIISINPNGKYPISGYKNATNIIFGNNKDKRFNYACKNLIKYLR
jgi:hypothetical protein